ncbi:MAG: DUF488 domain-containing protein [Elusimicrobia bacterium]|nr:DUF488 domain-containing protein [Elusimicrobiota bacterium]
MSPESPGLATIGAYGWDETRFFGTLRSYGADVFCDIRFRRGVRGREYAFVNSNRLQARLSEYGIRYYHCRELAPTPEVRAHQKHADESGHVRKRDRTHLDEAFVTAYTKHCLAGFDSAAFLRRFAPPPRLLALFCVEKAPEACHRSILAQRISTDLGLEVLHLQP